MAEAPAMVTLLLVGSWVGGCAVPAGSAGTAPSVAPGSPPAAPVGLSRTPELIASGSIEPAPVVPSEEAPMSRLRTIGPADERHEVVLRFGDRLDVVPPARSGGWVVADLPAIVRPEGRPRAASSYSFVAIAIGEGQLSLAPAGSQLPAARLFTVRIRVLRDTVQPQQP